MRVRERSGSCEEPHEQLAAPARAARVDGIEGSAYRDPYGQAVLLPPPVLEDTERWSTLLASDPIFSAPPPPPDPDDTLEDELEPASSASFREAAAAPASTDISPAQSFELEPTAEEDRSALAPDSLALDVVPGPTSDPPEQLRESMDAQRPALPVVSEPVPSSERLPISQPRSSGHFEDSVARAVETLDESSILTGAGTDLKRRGNLLSPHAKKREEPARLLRNRTPRSGSPAVNAAPEVESATLLPTEGPADLDEPFFAAPTSAAPRRRRLVPLIAAASLAAGVAGAFAFARSNTSSTVRSAEAHDGAPTQIASGSAPVVSAPSPASSSARNPALTPEPKPSSGLATALAAAREEPVPVVKQPKTHGLLRVDSDGPGRVFVQGIDVGPTGAFLELTCGMKFVRIAHEAPPPPGQSFPNWIGEAKSVMVPCGQAHRVALARPD